MINLITVCTGQYPIEYARKLNDRFRQVTDLPFEHLCITDRPNEVLQFANPITPALNIEGWWNKIEMFGPNIPPGWAVYIDLDVIIIDSIDEELRFVMSADPSGESIHCVMDKLRWHNNEFNSSFMVFRPEKHRDIFKKFSENKNEITKIWEGGDQVWIGQVVRPKTVYLDKQFPNLKKSLKFDLGKKQNTGWVLPSEVPAGVKLVDCSGRPKPHELPNLSFVKRNWLDI